MSDILPTNEQIAEFLASPLEQTIYEFSPDFKGWLFGSGQGVFMWVLIIGTLGIAALLLPFQYLIFRFSNYTITSQRVLIKTGFFVRIEDEIELYRVKDLKMEMTLLNRIHNIGSVSIMTSEASKKEQRTKFVIEHIKYPREIREVLRTLTEHMRQKRGVREIDTF